MLIRLSNMIGRHKVFGNEKKMNFKCKNEELLKEYDEIFKNISQKIDKELSSEPTFEND